MRCLIGIGTYTALDDSVGLRVAERIVADGLDEGFAVLQVGHPIDVLACLGDEVDEVLLVDAARMGREPGSYALFTPDEVVSRKEHAARSAHEGDLLAVLAMAARLGRGLPRITVMGIEPADTGPGDGLSAPLQARFDEYVEAVVGFFAGARR
jgi:hydrogenase maturation protease